MPLLEVLSDPATVILAIFVVCFLAPVLFLVSIRNAERRRREPWASLAVAFAWGAVGAIGISFALNTYVFHLVDSPTGPVPAFLYGLPIVAVLVAPLVEESAKALGLAFIKDRDPERHDGYIYGAAAGLGFAFTENLYYAAVVYTIGGQDAALVIVIFRGIATVCLHGAATALTGYGLWRLRFGGTPFPLMLYLPLAVLLHAAYNALASLALYGATFAAALLAILVYRRILRRVREGSPT